jgi:mRNA interferase MazF
MTPVRQKDIWYADLNPIKGREQAGTRPVVVLSGDLLNEHMNVVWVAPLTTKVKSYKGNPILKPDEKNHLSEESEVLIFHLRSISKSRLLRKVGVITDLQYELARKTIDDIMRL